MRQVLVLDPKMRRWCVDREETSKARASRSRQPASAMRLMPKARAGSKLAAARISLRWASSSQPFVRFFFGGDLIRV